MPKPPENIEREVRCPHCGEHRTTKAQPNTNLRCRNCGQLFKVPRPGGPTGDPASHAITGESAAADEQAPPAGVPPKRVTPKIDPAPPPPPGVAADASAGDGGLETLEPEEPGAGPSRESSPPEPPPEPAREPEPPPEKPRGAGRWRR